MKKKHGSKLPREELVKVERMENEIDVAEAEKAMRKPGPNIPWDEVRKELGL